MPVKKQFDLLVIGELNMDLILDNVESFPELSKEKIASDFNITLGSSSAIFASNISRLGVTTGFCGMVGQDDFGTSILQTLRDNNVDSTYIRQSSKYKTGVTVVIRYANDRAMVTYPGAMKHFSLQNIREESFQKARHLHLSSIFLQPEIKKDLFKIIEKAKSNNMTVSLDSQWDPDEQWDLDINSLVKKIDFFLPNEAEFLNFMNSPTVREGLEKLGSFGCTVVVKRGRKGATYLSGNTISTVPAFVNDFVVDAIGAGDSFNAGFICQFLQGKAVEQCVKFGNITGAVSTTETGGTKAITSLKGVLKIARNKLSISNLDDFTG